MSNVHPNSVIATTINNYNEDFYIKLTDMEYLCYENSSRQSQIDNSTTYSSTEQAYKPFFQSLNNGIVAYFSSSGFNREVYYDLMQSMYSFIQLNALYDYRNDLLNELNADEIFNINDFIPTVLGYADDYYDDLQIVEEENEETGVMEEVVKANNLQNDIAFLQQTNTETGALVIKQETNNKASTLQSDIQSAVEKKINRLLYEDQEIVGDSIPKEDMYQKVFKDHNYNFYYDFLGIQNVDPFEQ